MSSEEDKSKNPIRLVLRVVIFLALALALFAYLNLACMTKGSLQSRGTFDAFYDLEENSVDVMFIGASTVSRFFIPSVSYHDYGIAAYVFGPAGSPTYLKKWLIQEAERTQSPSLYVIDLHGVQHTADTMTEGDIRKTLDNINLLSPTRYDMAKSALAYTPNNNETLFDYLVPIAMYHSRFAQGKLTSKDFMLKTPYNKTQGFTLTSHTLTQSDKMKVPTYETESVDLEDDVKAALKELLDYCDTLDAEVLFVVAPGSYTKTQYKHFNAALSYVSSRGYATLNFNTQETFDETGLVWQTDYYNNHHTNYLGALKYTDYLSRYLASHYDLIDHRGDSTYDSWEVGYEVFLRYTKDGIKYFGSDEDESS